MHRILATVERNLAFTLRPWEDSDIESLMEYGNNKRIADFLTDAFPHPYTREKGEAFIAYAKATTPTSIFTIDIEGKASGGIGLHPQQDIQRYNAELGYWLAEPFWNHGVITAAIRQIVNYGFEHLPINRIFARPFGSNIASQKVLEKAGFTLEARFEKTLIKNNEWQDELVYAIRKPVPKSS